MGHIEVTVPGSANVEGASPQALRLALKYAYRWKCRVDGIRRQTHCHPGSGERCSVHHVIVRSIDGGVDVLRREQLPRFEAGCEPFGAGRVRARVREVPPQLLYSSPTGNGSHRSSTASSFYFVPLDIATYLGSDAPDFASLLFTAPTRVYLLLPSIMREPRWLRDLFVKFRDPYTGNHVSVPLTWNIGSGMALLLASGMRYQAFVRQRLMVWESVKVYDVDEELVLGGPGLAEMGDTLYVIATRAVPPATATAPAAAYVGAATGTAAAAAADGDAAASGDAANGNSGAVPLGFAGAAAAASMAARAATRLGEEAFLAATAPPTDERLTRDTRLTQPLFYRRSAGDAPGGSGPAGGWGDGGAGRLLARFIKVVKRDRGRDLQELLDSAPWERYCMSAEDVSFLPPNERYQLTVDLAVSNMSVPMLCALVDKAGCHLNYRALKLLVSHWDRLPEHAAGGGEGLLLRYLRDKPNPLSVMGAFLLAMRAELGSGRNHSAALEAAVFRFQSVQLELLSQLQESYYRTSEEVRVAAGQPLLEDILETPQSMGAAVAAAAGGAPGGGSGGGGSQPLVLSDYSPLRLAFRDHDTTFMSAQLIEGYTRRRWLGPEYVALTALDGHQRLSGLDPMLVYTIVANLGFVGDAGAPSMAATMRLWHLITMTSPAFFRSPRGRWAMKFMSTFAFLTMYMLVLATYKQVRLPASEGGAAWRAFHTAFVAFAGGNLLEGAEVMAMRYRNSAGRYFMAAPGEVVGVLVDIGIVATVTPCLVAAYTDAGDGHTPGSGQPSSLSKDQWTMLRLAQATLAILVWTRSLVIMVPLYRKLGPLIRTMNRMAGEVLAFVPLYVFVTLGFAVAFHTAIGDLVEEYDTFAKSVLELFQSTLGTFDYALFDPLEERLQLYSVILLTVYLILAALLLANLLIAIISYKYRPEEVRAESVFDLAEMVDRYRFQVKHHLICSPFNLVILVCAWLPAAPLRKLPPYEWVKFGLTPLDGLTFATPMFPNTPGGRHELPHLCYLLTLFPLIIAAANVLYYIHAPYAILYFALTGHRKLLREVLSGNAAQGSPGSGAAPPSAAAPGGGGGGGGGSVAVPNGKGGPDAGDDPDSGGGGVAAAPPPRSSDVLRSVLGPAVGEEADAEAAVAAEVAAEAEAPRWASASVQPASFRGERAAVPPRGNLVPPPPGDDRAPAGHGYGYAGGNGSSRLSGGAIPPVAGGEAAPPRSRGSTGASGGGGSARRSGSWVGSRQPAAAAPPPGEQLLLESFNGPGPVAENAEAAGGEGPSSGVGGGVGGNGPASPLAKLSTTESASGASKPRLERLRAVSLHYANSRGMAAGSGGSTSGRNLSGHIDMSVLDLIDDLAESANVEPPYMALLRLVTLSGLLDFFVSIIRFVALVLLGTVLYVFLMGLLAGTLSCCLVVWVGHVLVSVYRIVAGALRGARSASCLNGGAASGNSAAQGGGGAAAASGRFNPYGNGAAAMPASARWASVARKARARASARTYLTKPEVESAIRAVYTSASVLSAWQAAAGMGGGAAAAAASAGKLAVNARAAGVTWQAAATRARWTGDRGGGAYGVGGGGSGAARGTPGVAAVLLGSAAAEAAAEAPPPPPEAAASAALSVSQLRLRVAATDPTQRSPVHPQAPRQEQREPAQLPLARGSGASSGGGDGEVAASAAGRGSARHLTSPLHGNYQHQQSPPMMPPRHAASSLAAPSAGSSSSGGHRSLAPRAGSGAGAVLGGDAGLLAALEGTAGAGDTATRTGEGRVPGAVALHGGRPAAAAAAAAGAAAVSEAGPVAEAAEVVGRLSELQAQVADLQRALHRMASAPGRAPL